MSLPRLSRQNFDERGIVWPDFIAPFGRYSADMHQILPCGSWRKSCTANCARKALKYDGLTVKSAGRDVADMELIGIPHTIVIGDRSTDNDDIEYKYRRSGEKIAEEVKTGDIVDYLVQGGVKKGLNDILLAPGATRQICKASHPARPLLVKCNLTRRKLHIFISY